MTEGTGYNADRINELGDVINSTAQKAGEGIVEKLHSEIIVPISNCWWAGEAVEFFDSFKTVVSNCGEEITQAFTAFRDMVQSAGEDWANNTNSMSKMPNVPAVSPVTLDLSTSEIKEYADNGDVKIIGDQANQVAYSLEGIQASIKSDLSALSTELSAETAFLGEGQAAAVEGCFTKVTEAVSTIFKFLSEGENNLAHQIGTAVTKYGTIGSETASAFNNVSVE